MAKWKGLALRICTLTVLCPFWVHWCLGQEVSEESLQQQFAVIFAKTGKVSAFAQVKVERKQITVSVGERELLPPGMYLCLSSDSMRCWFDRETGQLRHVTVSGWESRYLRAPQSSERAITTRIDQLLRDLQVKLPEDIGSPRVAFDNSLGTWWVSFSRESGGYRWPDETIAICIADGSMTLVSYVSKVTNTPLPTFEPTQTLEDSDREARRLGLWLLEHKYERPVRYVGKEPYALIPPSRTIRYRHVRREENGKVSIDTSQREPALIDSIYVPLFVGYEEDTHIDPVLCSFDAVSGAFIRELSDARAAEAHDALTKAPGAEQ